MLGRAERGFMLVRVTVFGGGDLVEGIGKAGGGVLQPGFHLHQEAPARCRAFVLEADFVPGDVLPEMEGGPGIQELIVVVLTGPNLDAMDLDLLFFGPVGRFNHVFLNGGGFENGKIRTINDNNRHLNGFTIAGFPPSLTSSHICQIAQLIIHADGVWHLVKDDPDGFNFGPLSSVLTRPLFWQAWHEKTV